MPAGPNTSTGDGGIGTINVVTTSGGTTKGFTNSLTGTTFNNNAPNRGYINGVPVYCDQSNANPTTKLEDCTTGPGASAMSVATGAPITADPVIPATAAMTSGLVAPDGIVGVLPSYPGAPAGSTIVMYTEKELSYYVSGTTTNSAAATFGSTMTFTPSPYVGQDLPATISASSPVTVSVGDTTQSTIVPVTCTGLTTGATDTLTGCTVPSADSTDKYSATSLIGAPGATTVAPATLALTGEGSTSSAKLFKNNEDLAVIRVAYTTDGVNFLTTGLDNGGVISGQSNGAAAYTDLTNSALTSSPTNLNAYATPGTADSTELRWAGSAGSIIVNPDGSYGLFLSGAWAADGDSDAFNQIFYSTSADGEHWSILTTVVSTDYTFAASAAQDAALASGSAQPLGISAYYSGRAYGPSVVPNPDGTLTMLFAGYRIPKTISNAGTVLGTNTAAPYTIGATDPAAYRNILTETLRPSGVPVSVVASADHNPAVTGQAVTFTATVSAANNTTAPTGSVTFSIAGSALPGCSAVALSGGSAQCPVPTGFSAGTYAVVASYSGDAEFAAADNSASPLSESVSKAATTTTLTATPNPATAGQAHLPHRDSRRQRAGHQHTDTDGHRRVRARQHRRGGLCGRASDRVRVGDLQRQRRSRRRGELRQRALLGGDANYASSTAQSSITANPGTYLFVDENPDGPNEVRNYRVNADGTTTLVGSYATGHPGSDASWVVAGRAALAQTTNHLYALNLGDHTVSIFAVDPTSGALTLQSTTPPLDASVIAINPAGTVLYAGGSANSGTADEITSYAIAADGSIGTTPIATVSAEADGLTVSPNGKRVAAGVPRHGSPRAERPALDDRRGGRPHGDSVGE